MFDPATQEEENGKDYQPRVVNPERSNGDIFRELQRLSPGRYQLL